MLNPTWDEGAWASNEAHQGSGLAWQSGAAASVRMLGIVPSGDAADLQALWRMSAVLQTEGHPVLILDGTESERPSAPGLQELLQPDSGLALQALPVYLHQPSSIDSLPAARGLVQLAHLARQSRERPLRLLEPHVRNHSLVILLAPAHLLAPLLVGCKQAPFILVPPQRAAVLDCYQSLKQIFTRTGLISHLLALRPSSTRLDPVLRSVALCTMQHLSQEPLAQQIDPTTTRQLRHWAMQCLEQGEPSTAAASPTRPTIANVRADASIQTGIPNTARAATAMAATRLN